MRLLALLLALAALQVGAQDFPSKPVRFINAYAPGGPTDLVGRAVAQKLQDAWGQPVVVESRPGAAGAIGIDYVAGSPADGYTLAIIPVGNAAIIPFMGVKLAHDIEKSFVPVTLMANVDNVLVVHPAVKASSVQELLGLARAAPGQLTFSSPGQGSIAHVGVELLKVQGKVFMLHIPYKGVAPALNDVLGGQVTMMLAQASSALPHVKAGKLRALGMASLKRSSAAPEIRTIAEQGLPGFEAVAWYSLMAPAGTPREVVAKIAAEAAKALRLPDIRERFAGLGVEAVGNTPEEFAAILRRDRARWGELVRRQNLKFD